MSGFYQLTSSPMVDLGISPNASLQDIHDGHYQPHHHPPTSHMGNPTAPLANQYQSLGYYSGFPETIMFQEQKPQNSRRKKSTPGVDHVKHRRTRSGCYTCRTRRVKVREPLSGSLCVTGIWLTSR